MKVPAMKLDYLKHVNVFFKMFAKKCGLNATEEFNKLDIDIVDRENEIYRDFDESSSSGYSIQSGYGDRTYKEKVQASKNQLKDYEYAEILRQETLSLVGKMKKDIDKCLGR